MKSTVLNYNYGNDPCDEALKRVEVILDITAKGLIAEEWPEIEAADARLVVICNEHPDIREQPTADLGPKVARGSRCYEMRQK